MSDAVRHSFSTMVDALSHWADQRPDAVAYGVDEEIIRFGELRRDALLLARQLRDLGVGPGDRCAIVTPVCLDFFRALYATLYLRAWPVLLNPETPAPTIVRRLKPLDCRLALYSGDGAAWQDVALKSEAPPLPFHSVDRLRAAARTPLAPRDDYASPDVALLVFTSGTSDEPKAAMLTHGNFLAAFRGNWEYMQVTDDDVVVSWTPHFHLMGMSRFVYFPMFGGLPSYLTPASPVSVIQWLKIASRVRGTLSGGTDYGYRLATRLVQPETVNLKSLRYAFVGGEACQLETVRAFEDRFGLRGVLRTNYGMTEIANVAAAMPLGADFRVSSEGRVSSGPPVPGMEIRIADPEGRALPAGEKGEILLRGPQIFPGYFRAPEATSAAIRDGWLRTGDIGKQDADGWLYVLGREKSVIKRAGVSIMPREAEDAAKGVAGVSEAVAIGLPSPNQSGLDDLVVVCEVEAGRGDLSETRQQLAKAITDAVSESLGFAPADIIFLPHGELPRDINGKPKRAEILERLLKDR